MVREQASLDHYSSGCAKGHDQMLRGFNRRPKKPIRKVLLAFTILASYAFIGLGALQTFLFAAMCAWYWNEIQNGRLRYGGVLATDLNLNCAIVLIGAAMWFVGLIVKRKATRTYIRLYRSDGRGLLG